MSMLPYEIIDIILKMASTTSDIYYLQVDHKTGKLIYKYNMKCTRLSNLKIYPTTQFKQYLLHNNKMYNITYPIATNNNPSIKQRQIQVPLNFWFTKNPSLALPLLKLQNNEVYLEIDTIDIGFNGLFQVWSNILNMYVSPILYNRVHQDKIDITSFVSTSDRVFDVRNQLICSYVYLDSIERSTLLLNTNKINYVISTAKRTISEFNISELHKTIDITNANHHIKELIWIARRKDSIKNFNNHMNYTATPEEYKENMGILDRIEIIWNREISRSDNDAEYYNNIVPYNYHTNIPRTGLYCYSFSLFPEKQISAGSYDNTSIRTSLSIYVKENIKNDEEVNRIKNIYNSISETSYEDTIIEIVIYAIDVNILSLSNGIAGFKYS